jgi:hypothetical protein
MGKQGAQPYLRHACFATLIPADGATPANYAAATWRRAGSGTPLTYKGTTNSPSSGLKCGTVGNPGTGGFILGANANVYRDALARRGHPVSGADSQWVITTNTKATLSGNLPAVHIFGEALVDFLGFFDDVILDGVPPRELVEDIQRRSSRPGGTRVYLGEFEYDRLNQHASINSLMEPVRAHQKQGISRVGHSNLLRSNTTGAAPSTFLDPTGGTGSTSNADAPTDFATDFLHYWLCANQQLTSGPEDTGQPEDNAQLGLYAFNLLQPGSPGVSVGGVLNERYKPAGSSIGTQASAGLISGLIFGHVLGAVDYGVAVNRPSPGGTGTGSSFAPTQTQYENRITDQWRMLVRYMRGESAVNAGARYSVRFGKILASYAATAFSHATYDQRIFEGQVVDYFFHASAASTTSALLSNMRNSLLAARKFNQPLFGSIFQPSTSLTTEIAGWTMDIGPEPRVAGAGGKGSWSKLLKVVEDANALHNFSVLGARTAAGGVLFHHPALGPIR